MFSTVIEAKPGKPVPLTVTFVPAEALAWDTLTVADGTLWLAVAVPAVPLLPVPLAVTRLVEGIVAVVGTVKLPLMLPELSALAVATAGEEVSLTL
jgi:hypothetical protein